MKTVSHPNCFQMGTAFLIWTSILIASVNSENIKVAPEIYITKPEEGSVSSLGLVGGIRSCGGPGQVLAMRYEPCIGESSCKIPGDGVKRRSELEFIPSDDADALGILYIITTETGSQRVIDRPIANSAVQAGQRYIVNEHGGPTKEMVGQTFTFQYILYRVDNDDVVVCSEADFEVI